MSRPKPRMRPVTRHVQYWAGPNYDLIPQGTPRRVWLCVGCGCYVYRDTAEEAYKAWCSRRAQRFIESQRYVPDWRLRSP